MNSTSKALKNTQGVVHVLYNGIVFIMIYMPLDINAAFLGSI